MNSYTLRARWVLPISGPPIEGGCVTIAGDRIASVGTRPAAAAEDLGDVVLMPGLVNAHTHLEFSELTAPLGEQGMPLPEWIQLVISARKQREDLSTGLQAGLHESLRAGVTTIGDIATSQFPNHLDTPIPEVISFHEVIGFSTARSDSVFAELEGRLQSANQVHVGISPHAPYTVHPRLVQRLVDLACKHRLPMAMHLAESREELQLIHENSGPFRELLEQRSMWDGEVFSSSLRPQDYLAQLAKATRGLVVHGNYLEPDEIDFVAANKQLTIIYCPRTHDYFGHDDYPLQQMLVRGAQVAIGTDSCASNPDLSVLNELRCIANKHPEIDPARILQLGTIDGARALGLDNQIGSLAPGKLANLTEIECGDSLKPLEAVLHTQVQPARTWVRGQLATPALPRL